MGNLGWAEIAVIAVVALMVLGPEKLPGAARQIGSVIRQFRKISTGFQQELQNALDDPIEAEARRRGKLAVQEAEPGGDRRPAHEPEPEDDQGAGESEGGGPSKDSP
ncbi:MAG: Sec-independent protein translocase protein TatB [bacterium]|nr:Sec-independent protein translocase protein TatB [bacterium]